MVKALNIEARIARLQSWGRAELIVEWERLYGNTAPKGISRPLLIRSISYKWQEEIYGALSRTDQKLLDRFASNFVKDPAILKPAFQLKTGTRLRRLWKGRIHEVTAVQEGFVHEGIRYSSLSKIARVITGTRWNGLVFFGLKQPEQVTNDEDAA